MIKEEITDRNFKHLSFSDSNNQTCRLYESSSAMIDAIWFGDDDNKPMHLSQDNVKEILPIYKTP